MDWIKKHYDQFALAVLAVALIAASVVLFLKVSGFNENFAAAQASPAHNNKIAPLDLSVIAAANEELSKPELWKPKAENGSLFVSWRYLIGKNGTPERPDKEGMLHPPVPNSWFLKYNLDLLSNTVLNDDPDGDGFSNLLEYLGTDKSADNGDADATDPKNKDSHPPYYTKLFLKQFIKVPFRLLFNSYDGDPKKDKPEAMSFQINTLDLRQPTEFLKIGDTVRNTKFKIEKFDFKTQVNPKTSVDEDVSELTLLNTETQEHIVLVKEKVTDSPDSYALFSYLWPNPPQDIRVKKLQEFVLRPETTLRYKLIDITEAGAQIALPSGEKYSVPLLPK